MTRRVFSSLPTAVIGTIPVAASPVVTVEISVQGASEIDAEYLHAKIGQFLGQFAPAVGTVVLDHTETKRFDENGIIHPTHTFHRLAGGEFRKG